MNTLEKITQQIADNNIILYMKGSPQTPHCGFSAKAVKCLDSYNIEYAFVDVLSDPEIRQTLPQYANWPTFPQLYVKQELIGGSDIISDLHKSGELKKILEAAIE